jgi:hypothetical protein
LTRESPFILCEGNLISAEDTIFEHVNSHPKKNILGVDFNIGDHFRQPRIIAQTDGDEATVEAFAEEIPEVEATGQFVGVSKYADPELIRALRKKLDNLSAPRRREAEYEQICAELIEQGFRFHTADIDDSEWIKLKEPKDLEVAENIT